jgi:hypothetical protein
MIIQIARIRWFSFFSRSTVAAKERRGRTSLVMELIVAGDGSLLWCIGAVPCRSPLGSLACFMGRRLNLRGDVPSGWPWRRGEEAKWEVLLGFFEGVRPPLAASMSSPPDGHDCPHDLRSKRQPFEMPRWHSLQPPEIRPFSKLLAGVLPLSPPSGSPPTGSRRAATEA